MINPTDLVRRADVLPVIDEYEIDYESEPTSTIFERLCEALKSIPPVSTKGE